jgi:hypothetical protein
MKLLKDFPVNRLGSNFIVAVSHEVVGVVMEVVGISFTLIQGELLVQENAGYTQSQVTYSKDTTSCLKTFSLDSLDEKTKQTRDSIHVATKESDVFIKLSKTFCLTMGRKA